jgi:uncharacterized protein YjbJ (UPF0337 family)
MSNELRKSVEDNQVGGKVENAVGRVIGNVPMAQQGKARKGSGRAQADTLPLPTSRVDATTVLPGTPVVCSNGGKFAVVDHLEGPHSIKLKKDDSGQHHFIPLSWVTKVDKAVHVDRPGAQAMAEWSTEATP